MTDLEITKLCADAMGYTAIELIGDPSKADSVVYREGWIFRPLKDDAQAMALVKKLGVTVHRREGIKSVIWATYLEGKGTIGADLNRAICECVANMQKANPR